MSKNNLRSWLLLASYAGLFCMHMGISYAQEAWNLKLEPLYLEVSGADHNQANINTTIVNYSPSPYHYITQSFITSQRFDLGGNVTFRGQLEYKPTDWGIGISGWWFDTSDSINRTLNSSSTLTDYTKPYTLAHLNYTSTNFSLSAPPSNFGSVLSTSAQSQLGVWNLDLYGIKQLDEFEYGRVNLTFGAKLGAMDNKVTEIDNQGPIRYAYKYNISIYSKHGTAANSANTDILAGPSLGIQGLGKYGGHRIEGLLNQSVLIGNVNRKTISSLYTFTSNQDYYFSGTRYSNYSSFTDLSDSETVVIPVTDVKIKYLYDVTENLSLGLGFFASVWWDAPKIPAAQFNDREYKTLVFYGGLASVDVRF